MRREPQTPLAAIARRSREDDTRTYRFLTYVMGGGVQVKDHVKLRDEVTPVRAASIRGQLRFWWRACNPSGCETVQELRQREGEIWGTTSQPSKVIVDVVEQPGAPAHVQVYEYNDKGRTVPVRGLRDDIAYGGFPLQPDKDAQKLRKAPGALFDYGTRKFKVRFSYDSDVEAEVNAALWAWETFGGLGARTRRGFGAIVRSDIAPASLAQVKEKLQIFGASPRISDIPSLQEARLVVAKRASDDPVNAWKGVLKAFQALRQKANLGRNEGRGDKPAGRSRWPEPDEIRRLTGKAAPKHREPTVTVQRFPRARFGLPIVFHFEAGREGDPEFKPFQIHPRDHDRFPSSLILRPLPDGNRFQSAALALTVETPSDLVLTFGTEKADVQWQLDETLAAQIPVMNDRTSQGLVKTFTDPIDRFLWELSK
ncbi:MAG TPA: type III-B CRISPR module RAMP protein Cmr1 [Thermoanaerobaculia bacterium]|nr:type III-B CRISPR module RAMP protein Cmr1 [Thermoanaerobaculia bacterium]